MTNSNYWRVYTWVADPTRDGYLVSSILWTDTGPQDGTYKVMASYDTRDEAEAGARELQRDYDTMRRMMAKQ